MCLAVPGRVLRLHEDHRGLPTADVAFGDTIRTVCLTYLSDIAPGDYVLVQFGFAVTRLEPAEAEETLALLEGLGAARP